MFWSEKKKMQYIVVFILIIIFFLFVFVINLQKPTCNDGKQNQNEEGIDCGGVCERICSFSAEDVVVRWNRMFLVKNGIYNAVAYVENPNISFQALNMSYVFKFYDENGILIYERKGKTNIPAQRVVPVFEETIQMGNRIPKRTTFEFASKPVWEKSAGEISELKTENMSIRNENGITKLEASLQNPTLNKIQNIKIIAILFDVEGNAINSSKTALDLIEKDSTEKIVFTWPFEFADSVAKIEIIPTEYTVLK